MRGRVCTGVLTLLMAVFFIREVWASGGVVISEIIWDGVEYVELFNAGGEDVLLDGWKLTRQQDGGDEKEIVLFNDGDVLAAGDYFLVERSEDATSISSDKVASGVVLVNGGELLRLYDVDGVVIDQAKQFGAWFAGENTEGGVAMERVDMSGSGGTAESWQTSTGRIGDRDGTPGAANGEKIEMSPSAEPTPHTYSKEIVINEFLPNPAGSDSDGEWIELYDMGSETVNLEGWVIDDEEGGSSPYIIDQDVVILAGEYLLFRRSETGIALNNNGDKVRLLSPDGVVMSFASYADSVRDDESYNFVDGDYVASTTSTPGLKNVITPSSLEGDDEEVDEDGDDDNEGADYQFSKSIILNEFLPNPAGPDAEGEFIELTNTGSASVRLYGWTLDDSDGGSRPYTFDSEVVLSPGEIRSFDRSETGISLNNNEDSVRIIDPDGVVISQFHYTDNPLEGQSYNWDGVGHYVLSSTVTPGLKNVFDGEGKVAGAQLSLLSIEQVRAAEVGDEVVFEGVVVAPPGILGKTVMYVVDSNGDGIQVYSSKGDFGTAAFEDRVRVVGEVSSVGGEARVKIVQGDAIAVTGPGDIPEARKLSTGAVDELFEGMLVAVSGRVTSSSGSTFYIDDGSGDVKIVVKSSAGINKPTTKRGTFVAVVGIVSETTSGYRVLPRFQNDLQVGAVLSAGISTSKVVEEFVPASNVVAISDNPFEDTYNADQVLSNTRGVSREKKNMFLAFALGAAAASLVSGAMNGEPLWNFDDWMEYIGRLKDYVLKAKAVVRDRS